MNGWYSFIDISNRYVNKTRYWRPYKVGRDELDERDENDHGRYYLTIYENWFDSLSKARDTNSNPAEAIGRHPPSTI